jgi:hypothetical protein
MSDQTKIAPVPVSEDNLIEGAVASLCDHDRPRAAERSDRVHGSATGSADLLFVQMMRGNLR